MERPKTLGELRDAGYEGRSVKEEMRVNLVRKIRDGDALFPGIVGYDDSVIPGVVNAILARQNFILLGLRGQAKSRILRALAQLLDDAIPIVRGSQVNDDPLRPISEVARALVEECGDATPIDWVERDRRYVEKLATPDVTIADIVGDLDPIKAAREGHLLSDRLNIHFGLLPRANRGIFALNELPDLAGKIQVALFNVMQEGDVQIKGFPVRLPLDVMLVFTANPEDYTARGKIITPLKDRIGSEIRTHYPRDLDRAVAITRQESWTERDGAVRIPELIREVVERIAFAARRDKRVDQRSGVSQRMPIAALELAVSNAERRSLSLEDGGASVRIGDIYAALPAITGKLELEYEGELQGADAIARELVAAACADAFDARFAEEDAAPVVAHFESGGALRISDSAGRDALLEGFGTVPGLVPLAREAGASDPPDPSELVAACELVLEGLHAKQRISRSETGYERRRSAGGRPDPPGPGLGGGGALA